MKKPNKKNIKEKKFERKVRIGISWVFLMIASLIYFGLVQYALHLTNVQILFVCILTALWIIGYNYFIRNVIHMKIKMVKGEI
jgi:hypothetical protein